MKILVVDDNKYVAESLKCILQHSSHRVQTAENGEDGYVKYLQFEPDLIITDIEMPLKNGFALMHDVRSHNPKIKAIYMSGALEYFNKEIEAEKKRYTVDLLDKPFSLQELWHAMTEPNS
ncbi:MAG: response regulator [Desulfobacterales bacterium]|jgi:YesN/AraC family two-component response regulator